MTAWLSSFAPVVNQHTQVLILGSLPGAASLAARQYYAHPRNQFWRVMGVLLGDDDFASRAYSRRLEILTDHHIGLWDVVARAKREGSLDQDIQSVTVHPLAEIIATLPRLKIIAFNGKTATKFGKKALKDGGFFVEKVKKEDRDKREENQTEVEKLFFRKKKCRKASGSASDSFQDNENVFVLSLPSTSPAYTLSFEQKCAAWKRLGSIGL